MASGGGVGGVQVCPLCNDVVEAGDQLQLHYLTSCAGYDVGAGGGGAGRGKPSKPSPPPMTTMEAVAVATVSAGDAAPGGGTAPGNQVLVQFMWQPLTQMSYPRVTLLTSLGSGSIDLTIDSDEGGFYSSDRVLVSSGTYEGQLVVGDSFINPVKKFTVNSVAEQVVVLEFEVTSDKDPGAGVEDMYNMQQNPSFNQPYGGGGGGGGYSDAGSSHRQRRGKTGVAAGGDTLSNFDHRHHFQQNEPPSYHTTPPVYSHTQTGPPGHSDHPSHQLTAPEEVVDPPAPVRAKSRTTPTASSVASASDSASYSTSGTVSSAMTGAGGGRISDRGHRTSPVGGATAMTSSASTSAAAVGTGGSEIVVGSGETVKSSPRNSREHRRLEWVGEGEKGGGVTRRTATKRRERGEGREFSVDSLHNHRSSEDVLREMEEEVEELRAELARVVEEKDSLKQDKERVSALMEGKVRRLKKKLGETVGEEALEEERVADELDAARADLDIRSAEITSLTAQLKEREEEVGVKDGQLKEMKNMNAALENQLTEYMDALDHQNQSVQRSVESRQRTSADVAEYEAQMAEMTEYMRKQQLEYQEALQSLQKKVGRAEEMEGENLKIHQLNLNLTGELEDYRHQTKTLLADLRAKEDEIASLRERVGSRQHLSSDRIQLELDSVQQKCDAFKEEVEKLSHLRDQLARATQDNSQLQQEVARLTQENSRLHHESATDNAGLARQLESTQVGGEQGGVRRLERKASDYDQLMERVTELQQVRVQLENELSPLREERANILRENAALREGTNPERYLQLKTSYSQLTDQCVQLQKQLTDESKEYEGLKQRLVEEKAINARMEEANHELQTQLQETTDERGLQAIRDRMERYRSEREQLKLTVSQWQERDQETQQTICSLQLALEEATAHNSNQDSTGAWQEQVATLRMQLKDCNKRMLKYREERNTGRIMHKSLQEQINTLHATVEQLQSRGSYDTIDTALLTRLQLTDDSTEVPATGSPHEDAYSPEDYSDHTEHAGGGGGGEGRGGRRSSKQSSAGAGSSSSHSKQHRPSSTSGRSFSPTGGGTAELYAGVTMKDGVTRSLLIERPRDRLNYKSKPEVIVRRKGGKYETGVLAYAGVLDGKEMAGVILDLPTGNNDGTFKDGKYYFRCTAGHGLYCPMSNIYVEATTSSV